jgi:23S rRNA (uracil1939-C5)-methyltransferase
VTGRSGELVEVRTTGAAAGGGTVGRLPDGRVVFVEGALPDEMVLVEVREHRHRSARGRAVEVIGPNTDRIEARCSGVARGCGGCDLAHATPELQRSMKEQVVFDTLTRLGGVDPPPIRHVPLPVWGFRTTVRAGVDAAGRAGQRRARSHEVVPFEECPILHPLVEEVVVGGRFEGSGEVIVRAGAATGERLVVVDGPVEGVEVPDDVVVVDREGAAERFVHEVVAGHTFRISGRSFFQVRPDGAAALVETVRSAVDRHRAGTPARLVDLCSGVGLFAAMVPADSVVAVESNRAAVADARHNLAHLPQVRVDRVRLERWRPEPAEVVIADPARAGLGRVGVDKVVATGAELVVLVSCDPGSLGRDAGLLVAAGFGLGEVTLVDLFPHTHHVEVVSTFVRA